MDSLPSPDHWLEHFARLDDHDIVMALKSFSECDDPLLRYISSGIINRRLFRLEFRNEPFAEEYVASVKDKVKNDLGVPAEYVDFLVFQGSETNSEYSASKNEIKILLKDGSVRPMSESSDYRLPPHVITKHYLCYPKHAFDAKLQLGLA